MKEQLMQTIWALVQALSSVAAHPNVESSSIAAVAGVELKLVKENECTRFYESDQTLSLDHGIVVGTLEVRQSKQLASPPFIVLRDLGGTCITVDRLRNHVSDLTPPVPPSNPVPNAPITREARLGDRQLTLGFKWSVPDCLASIALQTT